MPIDITALFVALPVVGLTVFAIYFLCTAWIDSPGSSETTAESTTGRQKLFTGATWVLALIYVMMGLPKVGALSNVVHQFDQWGYPTTFMYFIGAVEFLGAILLLLPRIRLVAVAGLSVIMTGAIYTHIAFDPALYIILPVACLAGLIFVGWESYQLEWRREDGFRQAATR